MLNLEKKAVVLISGGLDSATTLAIAKANGYQCYALSLNYHQRHSSELQAAEIMAQNLGAVEHKVISLDLSTFGGSALTDVKIDVPDYEVRDEIPITYVPARNTIFLSIALAWAEVVGAYDIFYGANEIDYSGYPDCRPDYMRAFEHVANLATKAGVNGKEFRIHAPLIEWNKKKIIEEGIRLGVDYSLTISCYRADEFGRACGTCDSCVYRKKGFYEAAIADPTRYAPVITTVSELPTKVAA